MTYITLIKQNSPSITETGSRLQTGSGGEGGYATCLSKVSITAFNLSRSL